MPKDAIYAVYIMSSRSRNIYTGVTGNLKKRVLEHKCKVHSGYTAAYNCTRLVWFANFEYIDNAIAMENKIKSWTRTKKINLIESKNRTWADLSETWYTDEQLRTFGTQAKLNSYVNGIPS